MVLAAKLLIDCCGEKWWQNRNDSGSGETSSRSGGPKAGPSAHSRGTRVLALTDHLLVAAFGIAAALPEHDHGTVAAHRGREER